MNDLQSETLTHRSLCERFVGRVAGTTPSSGRPCPAPPPRQKSPAASSLDRIASSSAIGDKEIKQTHTHLVSVCIAETLVAETLRNLRVAAPEASDVGLSWVTRLGNIVSSCSACALWNWCAIALMVPCLRCLRNLEYQAHYYGLFGSCRAPGKVVHC